MMRKIRSGALLSVMVLGLCFSLGCQKSFRTFTIDTLFLRKPVKPVKEANAKAKKVNPGEGLSEYIRKTLEATKTSGAKKEAPPADMLEAREAEIKRVKEILSSNPDDLSARMALADRYFEYKVYDRALAEYNEIIKRDPLNFETYERLGTLFYESGTFSSAIENLKRAIELKSDSVTAYNTLGAVYNALRDFENAEKAFKGALKISPTDVSLYNNLCNCYLLQGRFDDAIEQCKSAVNLNPASDIAHNNLGYALAHKGNYENALVEFRFATDEAGAHNNLGSVYLEKKMFQEALAEFKLATDLKPAYRKAADNYQIAKLMSIRDRQAPDQITRLRENRVEASAPRKMDAPSSIPTTESANQLKDPLPGEKSEVASLPQK